MIRLHHAPGARPLRILWLLEERGVDYDLRACRLEDGSTRRPEVLALSACAARPAHARATCHDREFYEAPHG